MFLKYEIVYSLLWKLFFITSSKCYLDLHESFQLVYIYLMYKILLKIIMNSNFFSVVLTYLTEYIFANTYIF